MDKKDQPCQHLYCIYRVDLSKPHYHFHNGGVYHTSCYERYIYTREAGDSYCSGNPCAGMNEGGGFLGDL